MTNNKKLKFSIMGFAALVAAPVLAQEDGRRASLTISQDLRWSDNLEFDRTGRSGVFTRTDLGFALSSTTRTEQLSLQLGGSLDVDLSEETSVELVSPFVELSYGQETRSASFMATMNYRDGDISSVVTDGIDPSTGRVFLVESEGRRTDFDAGVVLEFGRDAPFGGSLELTHAQTDYSGTTDPDLLDITRNGITGALHFDIERNLRLTAGAEYETSSEDGVGSTDQTTQRLTFGVEADVRSDLTAGATIDYSRIETVGGPIATPVDRTEDGFGVTLNAALTLPTGVLSGELSSTVGESGRFTSASVTRSFEMRRGSIELTFGLTDTEAGDINPTYGLTASREFQQGELGVSLSQAVSSTADGEEALNSTLSVDYRQALTSQIGVGATLSLADTRALAGPVEEATRIDATISMSRSLNRDWDLVGGYTYRTIQEEGGSDVTSNTVFVGLSRSFDWRW